MAVKAKATITLIRVNDGKGVLKTEALYYLSISNTTQSGGSWVTSPPAWIDGRYYWQKIKTTYTDNSTSESMPVCITGGKGSTGSNGQGVSSITTQFYVSTSKTAQTGGSWIETMPAWSTGKYLWTRSKVIYVNPSKTVYTAPICDSSWEAVNNVQVGGKNLITLSKWTNTTVNGLTAELNNNIIYIHGTNTKKDTNWQLIVMSDRASIIKPGEVYAVSTTEQLPSGLYIGLNSKKKDGSSTPIGKNDTDPDSYLYGNRGVKSKIFTAYSDIDGSLSAFIGVDKTCDAVDVKFQIKLEQGNIVTDWTAAPEDISQEIQNAQGTANDALNGSNNANLRLNTAELNIDSINANLETLVRGKNGESLMHQTENGWQFDMTSFQDIIETATKDAIDAKGSASDAQDLANKANQLASDIAKKTAYINMSTDETGAPCIELGKQGNPFKVRITNTSIDFMQGSQKIAYITNQSLYIQSSVVTDQMQIGEGTGFIWKKRSNGNMGLRYIG